MVEKIITVKESQGYISQVKKHDVQILLTEGCENEHSCKSGCGACGGKKNGRSIHVAIDPQAAYKTGTRVEVRFAEINELIGALIVFGIPLTCALISLVVWYAVSPARIESGLSLLSAGASFAAGFGIVRLIDNAFRKRFPSHIIKTDPQS